MHTARPIVACWGELVWDLFDDESAALNAGQVLGGCGAAVAAQLSALGAASHLISAVGDDADGERALALLEQRGVGVSGVLRCPTSSTAAVHVSVSPTGEPTYTASRRLHWANVDFEPTLAAARGADALVFSLFAQGTCLDLGPLERALGGARPRWVGCDLNLRRAIGAEQLERVRAQADFLKLNQAEYERARQALAGQDPAAWLLRSGRTELVAVTSGARGARLVTRSGVFSHPGRTPTGRVDAVGAGDAFFAALTLALLARKPPEEALTRAAAHAEAQLALHGGMPKAPAGIGVAPR